MFSSAQAQESGAQSASAPDSAAIVTVVQAFHAALRSSDEAAVRRLLLPTARILEGGRIETVEEYTSGHMSADMAYAAAVTRVADGMQVFQVGDVAWVVSTSRTTGEYRGREIDSRGAEMMIVHRVDGAWRIAAIQWS